MIGAAQLLIPRLTGETRVIAILPRSNLTAVVDIMQSSDRVAGMMVAEDFDMKLLSAMATRVLAGDIFGLEKHVPWGAQIHSYLVGDYQEKSLCIAQVSEFAETMSVRRKYRESIEQCLDEMLMNALYDAPVDEQGRPIFSEIPTKTRISLRVEQKVVVQYACDGKQFVVGVRDAFGTLERTTVLRYLHKCLHSEQQIDRKAGGAGLGPLPHHQLVDRRCTSTCCPASRPRRCARSISRAPRSRSRASGSSSRRSTRPAAWRRARRSGCRPARRTRSSAASRPPRAADRRCVTGVLIMTVLAALGLVAVRGLAPDLRPAAHRGPGPHRPARRGDRDRGPQHRHRDRRHARDPRSRGRPGLPGGRAAGGLRAPAGGDPAPGGR